MDDGWNEDLLVVQVVLGVLIVLAMLVDRRLESHLRQIQIFSKRIERRRRWSTHPWSGVNGPTTK